MDVMNDAKIASCSMSVTMVTVIVGKIACGNRAFDELQERRKAGGKYRIGVEVLKTADRGYGVRSNRCFEAKSDHCRVHWRDHQ